MLIYDPINQDASSNRTELAAHEGADHMSMMNCYQVGMQTIREALTGGSVQTR